MAPFFRKPDKVSESLCRQKKNTHLHEEEQKPLPKFLCGQSHQTHEQKHTVQNGERNELDGAQRHERRQNEKVRKESRQTTFLDGQDFA